jgi:hypothetical protein
MGGSQTLGALRDDGGGYRPSDLTDGRTPTLAETDGADGAQLRRKGDTKRGEEAQWFRERDEGKRMKKK